MRNILLHVDSSSASAERTRWACRLAHAQGARLEGLYVQPRPMLPTLPDGVPPSVELIEREEEEIEREAGAERERFMAAADGAGCPAVWSSRVGDPAYVITEAARYADLVVLGQHDPDDRRSSPADLAAHALLQGGRPLVVTPHRNLPEAAANRVLVAWNDTPQAARALHDALDLLRVAEQVDLVSFADPDDAPARLALDELAGYLSLHGIAARAERVPDSGAELGWQLLDHAQARATDLLVMGGYGHSRLRELVLGGATREVLREATIPVLLSH